MIRLEQFTEKDFDQLMNWLNDEELLLNWSGSLFAYPLTQPALVWYITDTNVPGQSDAFVYKVIDVENGQTIGHISLGGISWKNRSARISRVLVGENRFRNKGYCKDMVEAVLKVAFEQLGLHRVALGVYEHNKAALQCYLKTGMQVEGVMREVLNYKEQWWTLIEMGMLENEWAKKISAT